jgi:PAS domain S-box-containing protein
MALVTLLVISGLSFRDWKRYYVVFEQTQQSRRILTLNESLIERLLDAETGQRGFLLTNHPEYLEPYNLALAGIQGGLRQLAAIEAEGPEQRRRFQELQTSIADKLAELRSTIELRRSVGLDAALRVVQTGQGKMTMDHIRKTSQEIEAAESDRWLADWNGLQAEAQRSRIVTLVGALLLAALVAGAGLSLRSAASQMERLNLQLGAAKASAEETSDLLRATLYSIGDGVITTNSEGAVQIMNTVAERLTGYQERDAREKPIENIFRIVNETTRNAVENPVRRVLRDGEVVGLANHTVLISKTGANIPIDDSGAPIAGSGKAPTGVVLVFRDVTERKLALETARHLAAIVEDSDDAIIGKTLDGMVTSWNRGAERLFGYSAVEMVGSQISRLTPPERLDEMHEILARVAEGEKVDHFETERVTKDGRRLTVALTISSVRDEEGHIVGASKIARDITRERQLEVSLRQTQKMDAIGRLAGGVAHDFNNLLTVILGYAATIKSRLDSEDPMQPALAEIMRAADHAASLTGQLLAFSRKQVAQARIIDLTTVVRDMKNMLERLIGEDIDLAFFGADDRCLLKADPNHLHQVLMNLAINARDAMLAGGKLTIETRLVRRPFEDLGRQGIRPAGQHVLLAVTDNGAGMDAETQAHIFEPFFTTKDSGKGTGLGLATVYGIVQQHGGWIDVYTEVGQGTTFKIYFPSAVEALPETVPAAATTATRRTATILLVEDQAAIRMLAEDVLSEAGHRVLSAGNGRAALRMVESHPNRIDLLVTDVVMPEMSGPELATQVARLRPSLIVLYISGFTDDALLHRGVIEEGTAFLQKPFLPETLLIRIDELLGSVRGQSGEL